MTSIVIYLKLLKNCLCVIFLFHTFFATPFDLNAYGKSEPAHDFTNMDWPEIVSLANETTVKFYMWGGSTEINTWIDTKVSQGIKKDYGITLKRVPMSPSILVNKLLAEKQTGKKNGVIDLVWINGENFKNAREADILWGPYAERLPNYTSYADKESAASDFGYPTNGYESPYGKAWFVLFYDSAKNPNPPQNFDELSMWIKKNPGRFTYPQPPDFTGTAFLKLAFYHANNGPNQFMKEFDQTLAEASTAPFVRWLLEINPFLWQKGENYPQDEAALDILFTKGEVDFMMNYNISYASNKILNGQYPSTIRALVLKKSALYNLHFTAIPFNAPNKAGAMVLANYLLSPEMQLSKNNPSNWGDMTALDITTLSDKDAERFRSLDLGVATPSTEELLENRAPEIPADYTNFLESIWEENILKR